MRLNKIQRLLGTVFLATIITGCSPQLTTETYIHEAGETLPEEVSEYATFKNPEKAAEAAIDLSNVVSDKVGTYEATITLKEKEYTIKDIKKSEQNGEYIITIVNRVGEENVVIVPKGQMEEENFSKEDVVYLDENGMLEQAYDKEDE